MFLYRGTKQAINIHSPQGLPDRDKNIENLFESIRSKHYPHRPSRFNSTFWTTVKGDAKDYAGESGSISKIPAFIGKLKGGFKTDQDWLGHALFATSKEEAEIAAHNYWKGIPKNYPEFLIPGKINSKLINRGLIGLGIAGLGAGYLAFSGKDDNYNTIEGLKHGGAAQAMRRRFTEFGSGWRGLFGGIKNVGKISAEHFNQVMDTNATWAKQADNLTKLPLLGGFMQDMFGAIRKGGAYTAFIPGIKPVVFLNKKDTVPALMKYGLTHLETELVMPVVRMHELSEAHHGPLLLKHLKDSNKNISIEGQKKYLADKMISSHYSMAVIGDEALAAASLGHDTFHAMKKYRFGEIRAAGDYEYERKTKKIYASVEKKWLHKLNLNNAIIPVPGKDDAYNTISGLLHGGLAQKMRKKFTPFGSGWDPLRNAVADQLGKETNVFQKFIRSSEFSSQLSKGKVLKELGSGYFGQAHLMETTIKIGEKEHNLQYVRKTPFGTATNKQVIEEAKASHKLSDLNAPNVYGVDKDHRIYMEFFQGKQAHEHMLYGGTIENKTIDDLEGFFKEAHKRGVAHTDAIRDVSRFHEHLKEQGLFTDEVTPYNVIITPEGRAGVYDWGVSTPADTKASSGILASESSKEVKMRATGFLGKDVASAADMDMELVAGLRRQKGRLSSAYTRERTIQSAESVDRDITPGALPKNLGNKAKLAAMASVQKQTNVNLFENARSGGRRSKSSYAASRRA